MSRPVVLIACGAKKLDRPAPAGELYQGSLFKKARAAALAIGADYRIVSALHGILDPGQVVAPYEAALRSAGGRVELEELRAKILEPIRELQRTRQVVALLPQSYAAAVPAEVENLLPRGLGIGRQLSWLGRLVDEHRADFDARR